MDQGFTFSVFLVAWLTAAIRLSGPLLLAALGETFSERSGLLNIGIEGTMLLGAITSYLVTLWTGSPWLGLLAAMLIGLLANTFLAWMYVQVQANQVVVGIIFNILALGVASYTYRLSMEGVTGPQKVAMFEPIPIPGLAAIPIVGPILFTHSILLYLTVALVAVAAFVLYRTRFGLQLRAAGENPRAGSAAGIDIVRMRYAGVLISGIAAAAAGAYLVLVQVGLFRETIVAGQGFIALAIVIFGRWDPWKVAIAAFVFGAADALQLSLQLFQVGLPPQLLLSLPYLLTILAMSGILGKTHQPEALMASYRRE
ncbi:MULTISPECIES: ABC transporter permease [unclassified Mesorhizobium]|uniref:ABC transporter permease n=1 Tax=unclassified Mesorhizobium TaxID=325217 RepID=UPI00096734F5|nr:MULTISPECIES: ABC transporter permease [unclassified Mesorhizobium]MBN9257777.1 ABC transporter permease [Mesorhizobium sp.]OJX73723.1 MAG: sugar ABC transporter permease [Mesorhizobium sp. 65-26]